MCDKPFRQLSQQGYVILSNIILIVQRRETSHTVVDVWLAYAHPPLAILLLLKEIDDKVFEVNAIETLSQNMTEESELAVHNNPLVPNQTGSCSATFALRMARSSSRYAQTGVAQVNTKYNQVPSVRTTNIYTFLGQIIVVACNTRRTDINE